MDEQHSVMSIPNSHIERSSISVPLFSISLFHASALSYSGIQICSILPFTVSTYLERWTMSWRSTILFSLSQGTKVFGSLYNPPPPPQLKPSSHSDPPAPCHLQRTTFTMSSSSHSSSPPMKLSSRLSNLIATFTGTTTRPTASTSTPAPPTSSSSSPSPSSSTPATSISAS